MKLDELLKVLEELEEDLAKSLVASKEKDEDEDLMDIFENSTVTYSLFSALERINEFMSTGLLFEATEECVEGTVNKGVEVINKCMKRHAKEMGYNYTFELKPVKE